MTLAQAQALLPDGRTLVAPHEPLREEAALRDLAEWAIRFSPLVAADPPDGLLIEVGGCAHLFGGTERLVEGLAAALRRLGFLAHVASAPTFGCAWAVARFDAQPWACVVHGAVRDALEGLPLESLRIDAETAEALREVGIDRVGHLLDLPRSSLAERFSPQLLRRIDQAMGDAPETIEPVRPVVMPSVECVFAGPVTELQAIQTTVRRLLEELSRKLEQRQCGVRRVELALRRVDAGPLALAVTLSRPSRDVRHLWSLLAPRVELAHLGWGVERVALRAARLGKLPHEQVCLWDAQDADADRLRGELLDELGNRLGPGRVVCPEPVGTHVPEKACRFRTGAEAGDRGAAYGPPAESCAQVPGDRPPVLLALPEPITVIALCPEGPPSWLRWRGEDHRIVASAGPERIAEEWWDTNGTGDCPAARARSPRPARASLRGERYARAYERFWLGPEARPADPPLRPAAPRAAPGQVPRPAPVPARLRTRDYFKIQDERGCWLWVFRLESGGWFVHGLWA
jgi:protein ImuB